MAQHSTPLRRWIKRCIELGTPAVAAAVLWSVLVSAAGAQAPSTDGPAHANRHAGYETGTFSEFDSAPSILRGTLATTQENAFEGMWSAKGSIDGSPLNGFSRAVWSVTY